LAYWIKTRGSVHAFSQCSRFQIEVKVWFFGTSYVHICL